MGWNKRLDYFEVATKRLAAKRSLIKEATRGEYDTDQDMVRTLLWRSIFDYYDICRTLDNGRRDGSIKRDFGVSINSEPVDGTVIISKLLTYHEKLTFKKR